MSSQPEEERIIVGHEGALTTRPGAFLVRGLVGTDAILEKACKLAKDGNLSNTARNFGAEATRIKESIERFKQYIESPIVYIINFFNSESFGFYGAEFQALLSNYEKNDSKEFIAQVKELECRLKSEKIIEISLGDLKNILSAVGPVKSLDHGPESPVLICQVALSNLRVNKSGEIFVIQDGSKLKRVPSMLVRQISERLERIMFENKADKKSADLISHEVLLKQIIFQFGGLVEQES